MNHSRFMHFRNDLANRIWAVTDRLDEVGSHLYGKELNLAYTVLHYLPTPATLVRLTYRSLTSLAFKVSKTCPKCDSWPCECGKVPDSEGEGT